MVGRISLLICGMPLTIFNLSLNDSVQIRFSFISDSIFDSKDGLMFDYIQIYDGIFSNNEEVSGQDIEIYPNPTSDILNLRLKTNTNSRIELYNLQGELINSWKVESNNSNLQLDISQLEVGVYVLRVIENGDVVLTEKILKE